MAAYKVFEAKLKSLCESHGVSPKEIKVFRSGRVCITCRTENTARTVLDLIARIYSDASMVHGYDDKIVDGAMVAGQSVKVWRVHAYKVRS